jgi:hypothetical protein
MVKWRYTAIIILGCLILFLELTSGILEGAQTSDRFMFLFLPLFLIILGLIMIIIARRY